ncbi:hypothetical protein SAMN06298216_0507 [Spirosomataceae bacterium TFI 002]|nr:hypothetical protein SAMN06298216_0507 [Spirosomataceae bacterium TFI 002]
MKRIIGLVVVISFVLNGCKEKEIVEAKKSWFVSEITKQDNESWKLTYDSNKKVSSYMRFLPDQNTTVKYNLKYNLLGLVESITFHRLGNPESSASFIFSYNSDGKLISFIDDSNSEAELAVVYEKDYTLFDYLNRYDMAFFLKEGNIARTSCFDCPPLIDEYKYSALEFAIPNELKTVWPLADSQPYFLGTSDLLSKNIPTKFSLATGFWGGEMINEIETNAENLPINIKTTQGKAVYGTNNPDKNDTWTIKYVEL